MLNTRSTLQLTSAAAAIGTLAVIGALQSGSILPTGPLSGAAHAAPTPSVKTFGRSASPAVAAGEFQSTAHARKAGITACLAGIEDLSRASVAGSYAAISDWSAEQPDGHMFTSIVGQSETGAVAPRALSVLLTSPQGPHRCDRAAVEIHPSALSCEAIAATLQKPVRDGEVSLSGIPVMQAAADLRYALIPSPGPDGGCVVVGIRTRLAL